MSGGPQGTVDDDVPRSGIERSSRVLDVGKGFTWWTTVDVFAGGGAGMSEVVQAIRSSLECMRIGVRHWPIANEGIARGLFSGAEGDAPYVVLAMHGDHGRLLFLPSSPESGMKTSYSVEELAGIVRLRGRVVVSVGCASGSPEFAEVFLSGGASAYIAPVISPFGHAAPVFVTLLFFALTQGRTLEDAVEVARAADRELAIWQLFTPDGG